MGILIFDGNCMSVLQQEWSILKVSVMILDNTLHIRHTTTTDFMLFLLISYNNSDVAGIVSVRGIKLVLTFVLTLLLNGWLNQIMFLPL